MSDFTNRPPDNPVPPEEEKAADITKEVYAQLTQGERYTAIAAVIIIVVNLIVGQIIAGEYSLSNSTWLIPLGILFATFFYYRGRQAAWHRFYPWLAEVGGWAVLAIGIVALFSSIFNGFPSGSARIFALVFYVAAGLMGVGAYFIHQDRGARI